MSGNSIAVWISGEGSECPPFEVHINYWRMKTSSWRIKGMGRGLYRFFNRNQRAQGDDLLEIGVMVKEPEDYNEVNIFLPLAVARENIIDCSGLFKDTKILQGIFNEHLSITDQGSRATTIQATLDGIVYTSIFQFDKDSANGNILDRELAIKTERTCTHIKIPSLAISAARAELDGCRRLYFRIRIALPKNNPFMSTIMPYDRTLQSGHEEIDYIDFRLNEARSLTREIQAELLKFTPNLRKVSFLTAVPISLGLAGNGSSYHKLRVLEQGPWAKYVNELPDHMMVYHWREYRNDKEGSIHDFSAFAKFSTRRSGRNRVMIYILIFFFISILSSLTAAAIYDNFQISLGWPPLRLQDVQR